MTPEMKARGLISIAKGGIDIAGIDERILIPNIVEALRKAYMEGRRSAFEEIARDAEQAGEDLIAGETFATVARSFILSDERKGSDDA